MLVQRLVSGLSRPTTFLCHCGLFRASGFVGWELQPSHRIALSAGNGLCFYSGSHFAYTRRALYGTDPQSRKAVAKGTASNQRSVVKVRVAASMSLPKRLLKEEVGLAIRSLGWPPLVARGWETLPAEEETDSGVGGVGARIDADAASAGGGAESRGGWSGEQGGGGFREGAPIGLRVMSWNVLCDGLSGSHPDRGGFIMAPEGSLDWKSRRWKVLEEILRWDCDVLALQEVDHHHDWLSPMLAKSGYRSLFVKKPIAPGQAYDPTLQDGCSLFYRAEDPTAGKGNGGGLSSTLELLDAHSFTFAVAEHTDASPAGNDARAEDTEDNQPREDVVQNQVAAIALFRVRVGVDAGDADDAGDGGCARGPVQRGDGGEDSLLMVATTHLKAAKTKHGETIRARQAQQLLDEVSRFRAGHEKGRGLSRESIPLIIAGDFNATPHLAPDGRGGGYEPTCYRQVMSHPLALRSAFDVENTFTTWKIRPAPSKLEVDSARSCDQNPAMAGEGMARSSSGEGFKESKHCIDYMWISRGVRAVRRSTSPSEEGLGPLRAPSLVYPSDHFAIAVDLRLPHSSAEKI